jgi:putative ABC transport system permease protein
VIVLTLTLGIGANTAMFGVVNSVILRPLPFRNAPRLVSVWTTSQGSRVSTAYPDYLEVSQRNRSFESLAAYTRRAVNVTGKADPERLRALVVTPSFLSVLGVQPKLGRDFVESEGHLGANHVVIITDRLWRRSFGADPGIIGQTITLDEQLYTVIGVLSPEFWFLDFSDLLVIPLTVAPGSNNRGNHFLNMIGRLRIGMSREYAGADLSSIANAITQETSTNQQIGFDLGSLQEEVVANIRRAAMILMAAVGFVLLIACGNLASLLLARAVTRERETAIRTALGATRGMLLRQYLTESILLSLIGGIGGVFCAAYVVHVIRLVNPGTLPRAGQVHIDLAVLLFALGASILTGIIFGVIPVIHASKLDVNSALMEGGNTTAAGAGQYRIRAGVVVTEIALALVLLSGAGLMVASLHSLRAVQSGFDENSVLIFNVNLPAAKYLNPDRSANYPFPDATARANAFLQQAVDRLKQIQGVRAVGVTSSLPLSGISWDKVVTLYDRTLPSTVEGLPPIEYRPVVGDYFRALGIRLIWGREFDAHDNLDSQPVAVVNEEFVRRYMNSENPIGKTLSVNPPIALLPRSAMASDYPKEQQKFTIIGVVGNARYSSLQLAAGPMVYAPYAQDAEGTLSMWFAVRTDRDPLTVIGPVRHEISEIDKGLPLGPMSTMEDVVSNQIGRPRMEMFILCAFGALALILAGVGIYGVMSYSVAQRTREIGIRIALGARLSDILGMVMRQGILLIGLGMALGFAGAVALSKLMKSMIFDIGTVDPQVYAAACCLLLLAACTATYFPARRAMRTDPMIALRYQ